MFTQSVKVQPLYPSGQLVRQILPADAQPAARRTWIINGMSFLGGVLWIHPQSYTDACGLPNRAVHFQLCERVETNVIADFYNLRHFFRGIGRAENMVFLAWHFLMGQPRLKKAAGRRTSQILSNQRINPEHRKGLLCQQNMAAGALLHTTQDLQIMDQSCFIHHIDRCIELRFLIFQIFHYSTVAGCSSTTQGRPYWFSISIKGSGSISSRLWTPGWRHLPFATSAVPIMAGTPVV